MNSILCPVSASPALLVAFAVCSSEPLSHLCCCCCIVKRMRMVDWCDSGSERTFKVEYGVQGVRCNRGDCTLCSIPITYDLCCGSFVYSLTRRLRFTAIEVNDVIVFSQLSPSAVLICGTVADAEGSSFSDQVADRHCCLGQLLSGPCSTKGTPRLQYCLRGLVLGCLESDCCLYICFTCSRVHCRHLFDLVPHLAYMHTN